MAVIGLLMVEQDFLVAVENLNKQVRNPVFLSRTPHLAGFLLLDAVEDPRMGHDFYLQIWQQPCYASVSSNCIVTVRLLVMGRHEY